VKELGNGATPEVTVVVPAYKAARTIRRTIDSLLPTTEPVVEVIVVVDGHCEDTIDILATYGNRVTSIVHDQNRGAQASRNHGLVEARGEFVMFLDSDDFVEGPLISGLLERIRHNGAEIAFGPTQILDEVSGRRLNAFQPDYASSDELFLRWFGLSQFVASCSVLWRTSYVRQIGGWDEHILKNQDAEIALRAILLGASFCLSHQGCGIYVHHPSPDRISVRSDTMESTFAVAEKLLAIETRAVQASVRAEACARRYYTIARNCYHSGLPALGDEALARSRALGFTGHQGSTLHRMLASLIGMKKRYALTNFLRGRRFSR